MALTLSAQVSPHCRAPVKGLACPCPGKQLWWKWNRVWWDWEGSQTAQSGHQQSWERDFASSAAKGIPCCAGKSGGLSLCPLHLSGGMCSPPGGTQCPFPDWHQLGTSSDRLSSRRFWLLSVVVFFPATGGTSLVCREYPQAWQMPLLSLTNFISHSKRLLGKICCSCCSVCSRSGHTAPLPVGSGLERLPPMRASCSTT